MEQRYQAVLEVLNDGATVTDVARRYGVARQTVHGWLRKYADRGLAGLVDQSSRPLSCPHQMAPTVEARIVAMRRVHPGWGARTIRVWLEREGVELLPGRTSIERCLVRHGLVTPEARKRKRPDYKRWERARAMELWQMDIVGGVRLADGSEAKIVSGIDDHSRFVISAHGVARATARPVCDALGLAMRRHGVPDAVLTDIQRQGLHRPVRAGPGAGALRPDLPRERHPPPPHGPAVTDDDRQGRAVAQDTSPGVSRRQVFASLADAQAQLDAWVEFYNDQRPHQSLGGAVPWDRFRLASPAPAVPDEPATDGSSVALEPAATRQVGATGLISFASARYRAGRWLAGEDIDVVCEAGLVQLYHRGVLIATHARRHPVVKQAAGLQRVTRRRPPVERPTATTASVTRKVDSSGSVCFAGTTYRAGSTYRRRQVQVAVIDDHVEISVGETLIRRHPIRHDRTREHGALANPGGRPHRTNAA